MKKIFILIMEKQPSLAHVANLETGSTKKEIRVRSAPIVILFILVNKELSIPVSGGKFQKEWRKPEVDKNRADCSVLNY